MKTYMNEKTGSIDTYEGWGYENEEGLTVNAVDLGEVVEVERVDGVWVGLKESAK